MEEPARVYSYECLILICESQEASLRHVRCTLLPAAISRPIFRRRQLRKCDKYIS